MTLHKFDIKNFSISREVTILIGVIINLRARLSLYGGVLPAERVEK